MASFYRSEVSTNGKRERRGSSIFCVGILRQFDLPASGNSFSSSAGEVGGSLQKGASVEPKRAHALSPMHAVFLDDHVLSSAFVNRLDLI